jgi:hypothetical protein
MTARQPGGQWLVRWAGRTICAWHILAPNGQLVTKVLLIIFLIVQIMHVLAQQALRRNS